jgi:membrane protease YdiL (CAAX protease family)
MRFLVDPALVTFGPTAWFFLTVVCVGLPLGALRQHRRLAAGTLRPTRAQIYQSAIATHAMFLLMAWAVLRGERLGLFPAYHLTALHLVVGLVALAIGLLPLLERFRRNDEVAKQRVRLIAPRTPREFAAFYLVCVTAGVAEELTYRGVLFTLLAALIGGWWPAALIASAMFGIVHLFQGWKSAGIAALMGLREHIVVGLTGTLFIAMAVHMLHDAVAGTVIGLKARGEEDEAATAGSVASAENVTGAVGAAENA